MSEESMIELVQAALAGWGIDDTVRAVGQFSPRGRSGAIVAGGLIGDSVGGAFGGSLAAGIGLGAGVLGGSAANRAASGLPASMLVAVSDTAVYGMHAHTRHTAPDRLLFALPRSALTVRVHQRVNVRVLELIHDESGSRVELEGSRIPLTHSGDVIHLLTGSPSPPDGQRPDA
jgi:hypothetical protein